MLRNPDLASFLETLPEDQGREFYEGEIARRLVQDMERGQGLLTLEDLKSYQVIQRKPLEFSFAGCRILTNPPPSFGGSLIALTLKILDKLSLEDTNWGDTSHLLTLAGTMKKVDEEREGGFQSIEDVQPGRIGELALEIQRSFSRGTTHVSVADAYGNVASMTNSNGEGSGYIAPGTGVMLNNMMGEEDLHPEGFHGARPGVRVSSMMSPSLILQDQEVRLVLGSGGSKRIRTAISQVILNYLLYKMNVDDAVKAPRIHWDGAVLQVEPGFGMDALKALNSRFEINVWSTIDVYFGGVHAVEPGGIGEGDPRRGGCSRTVYSP